MAVTTGNFYLTQSQMEGNVDFLAPLLQANNWTLEAISGMLGNAEVESTINPGIWQALREGNMQGGYGVLQWTPASKYINWCITNGYDSSQMEPVVYRLKYELENHLQYYKTSRFPLTFSQFIESEDNPADLAEAWLYNYERPKQYLPGPRRAAALRWWTYLTGGEPPPEPSPTPKPPANLPMPFIFYTLKRRF